MNIVTTKFLHNLRYISDYVRVILKQKNNSVSRKYMRNGISVFLDVPLEALAQRIAAVGTNSRPLLHHESGDAYTKVNLSLAFFGCHIMYDQS